jgi:hypothetical protein
MSKNKPMHGFLIVIIAISLLSLSVLLLPSSITMANAQVSSNGDNNHRDDSGTDKRMGICIIGVRSPCNDDT